MSSDPYGNNFIFHDMSGIMHYRRVMPLCKYGERSCLKRRQNTCNDKIL